MKYFILLMSLIMLTLSVCQPMPTPTPTATSVPTPSATPEPVVLTLGAWRTSTERMNNILKVFNDSHPAISVQFAPTLSGEYDAILQAQLGNGTAPDMFYLRSFATSQMLFEQGHLTLLNDLPGLQENFADQMLDPWRSGNVLYGVPYTASSHGIYYNQDIFTELGLSVPETWEEVLQTAQALTDAGYIPFANSSKDDWALAEIMFMNLAPNFVGGYEGRHAYLQGERCFNDKYIVATFQAIMDMAPFLPQNHSLLGYIDSLQLFVQGQAGMWMSGSWDIPYFEESDTDMKWSVFAIPAPAGQPTYVTFHLDVAIGLNAASAYKEEARVFLQWLTTPEFGKVLGDGMPGFFPMHKATITLENPYANTFLSFSQHYETDIRFTWEILQSGTPSGYTLVYEGTRNVINGTQSPEQAANMLQSQLAMWLPAAQTCPK